MAKAKDIEGLSCEALALEGAELVLRTRWTEMREFRAAALDWSDPEGVHDMRVASRRLRSVLADFAKHLRARLPRRRLRALARQLGAVRDEDVALAALEELARADELELGPGLNAIIAEHQHRREHARAELTLALDETALDALQEKFFRKLDRATTVPDAQFYESDAVAPARTFKQMAREIILTRLADLGARGRALYRPHDVEPLHRLRIAAKRLRYALELFAPCWVERLTDAADEVAKLQKALGLLHDCDVWIEDLGAQLDEAHKLEVAHKTDISAALTAERRAAFRLLNHFAHERAKHYHAALEHWEHWEATAFFARLRAYFTESSEANNVQA